MVEIRSLEKETKSKQNVEGDFLKVLVVFTSGVGKAFVWVELHVSTTAVEDTYLYIFSSLTFSYTF